MKKGAIFLLVFLLVGVGFFVYSIHPEVNLQESEAGTPDFFSLSPKLRLMARTIHAEARGEPFIGKVAVGAVIMNRYRDADFPNTIPGVIYQPWAFTPVMHGIIWNLTPDEEAVRATLNAYRGWDPTYGSLFFYNPAKVTSHWIFSREVVTRIGKHVYAR